MLDFFLLLFRDQLLCIGEKGDIIWERKVFYKPYPTVNHDVEYANDRATGRMYADDIEAYLYDDVLIINDHVNIIAIKVKDGTYLWSMTNRRDTFEKEKLFPPVDMDNLYKKFGIDRLFLKSTMFYTVFSEDHVVIIHGNMIYFVQPFTGYCVYSNDLGITAAITAAVSDGNVYVVSYLLDTLKVFNDKLELVNDFPLDFIEDKETPVDVLFFGSRIILDTPSYIYALNKKTGQLESKLGKESTLTQRTAIVGESLFVIRPFEKIDCYRYQDDELAIAWQTTIESSDPDTLWKYREIKTQYYFIVNKHILLPFRRGGSFFLASVNMETGKKEWEREMDGIRGLFYDLSNYRQHEGKITFVLTTGCEEIFDEKSLDIEKAESIFFSSKLCMLKLANGPIISREKMPSLCGERIIVKSILAETKNNFIFSINGKIVLIKDKKL